MTTVTVEEARGRLKDIIAGLGPDEALVIVQDGEPVATLARAVPLHRLNGAVAPTTRAGLAEPLE